MLETLARTCYRRRRFVVVGWILLVVVLSGVASAAGGEFRTDFSLPGSESDEAGDLLEEGGFAGRAGMSGQVVVAADDVQAPEVRQPFETLLSDIRRAVPEVGVVSPYGPDGRAQVAPDGSVAFAELDFGDVNFTDANELGEQVAAVREDAQLPSGTQLELGGDMFVEEVEFSSEAFGFLAAAVILLIAFGSVLAMGLPLITALFGIGCGMALVQLTALVLDVPDFAPAAVAMIAIGVGIDYALFVVTRYREELGAGLDPEAAVVRTLGTAGKAVVFAGSTVVVSLLGLLLVGLSSVQSLAVGASAGVLMVMLASMTLLPALLGFAGRSIDRLGLPHRRQRADRSGTGPFWYRWSRLVQRRPWPVAIIGLVLLLALTAPVLAIRLGFGDAGNRPDTDTTRRAYDLISEGFGPGFNGPLILAVDLPGDRAADADVLDRLGRNLASDPGVQLVTPPVPNESGDVAFAQVFPRTSPQEEATSELVHRLRDDIGPAATEGTEARVLVGGITAGATDFAEYTKARLPLFIGAVLVLSFLLLAAVFRSVLVPLKAVIMNLLSIGAAYGVVVATFQWGWLGEQLGLGEPGPVEAWAPIMMFAIVFGLSMDYEVFLLSRIREEYQRTGDNATAVADGLARTARLISAAALIMLFVFGGFVLSIDRALQLFGLGLAVAVFVDATIVRLLLVPATMELLGDRNWWLPNWMNRILPTVRVEGPEEADRDAIPTPVD